MLAQILWHGYQIAEVSCPTKYFADASSINLARSIRYGIGCLYTALAFRLAKMKMIESKIFFYNKFIGPSHDSTDYLKEGKGSGT
jgi:hypothetical protein